MIFENCSKIPRAFIRIVDLTYTCIKYSESKWPHIESDLNLTRWSDDKQRHNKHEQNNIFRDKGRKSGMGHCIERG